METSDKEIEELLASLPDNKEKEEPIPDESPIMPPPIAPIPDPPITPNIPPPVPPSDLIKKDPQQDGPAILLTLLKGFPEVANRIITNHAADREQVETAIQYFESEVKKARQAGDKSPAMIEGWVKLMSIKAEINANANSVLDSSARFLAAAKNNDIIINFGNVDKKAIDELDLTKILSQPPREDEILIKKSLKNGS